jgi:hypothetical protein
MIFLKNLSEFEVSTLIKKGGMLLYSLNWKRYQEPGYADRFLVLKTRKQNHSINRRVTTINVRNGSKSDKETTLIWRNSQYWAYIAPKGTNVKKCKESKINAKNP